MEVKTSLYQPILCNKNIYYLRLVTMIFTLMIINQNLFAQDIIQKTENDIILVVRGDDMGFSHAANTAFIQSYQKGILTSAEVIVPGPWFLEAAKLLNENPGLDAGVHLTLTCEWDNYKWRPLTHGNTITDDDGYFFTNNNKFRNNNPDLKEVETELRSQIELAQKYILNLTHLTTHMGTAQSTPELKGLLADLSEEYRLPIGNTILINGITEEYRPRVIPSGQKKKNLIDWIKHLVPGCYIVICHPTLSNAETKEIHSGNNNPRYNMAENREVITNILTSNKVKRIVKRKGIKLMSLGELHEQNNNN